MNFIDRKSLEGKTNDELMKYLDLEVKNFKESVSKINTIKELKQFEEDIMKQMDVNDGYLKELKYDLPEKTTFEGESYNKGVVSRMIVNFLGRMDVKWELTTGCYELVKFWRNANNVSKGTISYGAYDSTLRMLNQLTFKGFQDWRDILTVNEYMKGCHEMYTRDTGYTIYLHELHNAVIERMTLVSKPAERVDETEIPSNP